MKSFFAKLLGISQLIWDFLVPILARQVSLTLTKLLPVALSIVTELAKDNGMSGSQKRDKAVSELKVFATEEGLDAANSLINLTVEMAVNKLKTVSEK